MQRALQQARAEAAAQAQGTPQPAPAGDAEQTQPESSKGSDSVTAAGQQATAGKDKKALGALLARAAQKMQQEEAMLSNTAETFAAQHQQSPAAEHKATTHMKGDDTDDAEHDLLDSAGVEISGLSQPESDSSSTEPLLPDDRPLKTPTRGPSLGERLGSILRGALSLPRQSSYAPVSREDDDAADGDDGPDGDDEHVPGIQRALPRDASYLPEWLNNTLRRKSTLGQSFTAKFSGSFSAGSGVSRAGSTLPEWVDISALQSGLSESDPQEPGQMPTAPAQAHQESVPELFKKALKPVKPAPLLISEPTAPLITAPSWPPSTPRTAAAASKESRGKRLLAFWQQQQPPTSEQTSQGPSSAPMAAGQKPAGNQAPAHTVHARSRALQPPGLQLDERHEAKQLEASTGTS